jgi:YHS domain-containing protein
MNASGATCFDYGNYLSAFSLEWGENSFTEENSYAGVKLMTKDPVCGMNVDENKSQYQSQYGGKKFNFCSEQCKKEFDKQPQQYARSAA